MTRARASVWWAAFLVTSTIAAHASQAFYYPSGPLRGSLIHDRPVPIYAPDPTDPWNRIVHLLYTRKTRAMLPTYFQDPSAEAPRPPRVDGQ
ncbi:MAG: hypothetical protein DMD81_27370, partial [Candidatus Rokuibacteriota bacterium]